MVGIEARGFILAAPIAYHLGAGFVPMRKKGKLPWTTYESTYALEYGSATIEVHRDAFAPGDRVLIVDDVLATGGTAVAALDLVGALRRHHRRDLVLDRTRGTRRPQQAARRPGTSALRRVTASRIGVSALSLDW